LALQCRSEKVLHVIHGKIFGRIYILVALKRGDDVHDVNNKESKYICRLKEVAAWLVKTAKQQCNW